MCDSPAPRGQGSYVHQLLGFQIHRALLRDSADYMHILVLTGHFDHEHAIHLHRFGCSSAALSLAGLDRLA